MLLTTTHSVTDYPMNQDDEIAPDVDEVIIRFTGPYSDDKDFGKPSYLPLQEQTEKGLAKFYSVFKYLVQYFKFNL